MLRLPQPMSSMSKLAVISKSYTSAKKEDDLGNDSKNTIVTQNTRKKYLSNWPPFLTFDDSVLCK